MDANQISQNILDFCLLANNIKIVSREHLSEHQSIDVAWLGLILSKQVIKMPQINVKPIPVPLQNLIWNLTKGALFVMILILWKNFTKIADDIFRYIFVFFDILLERYPFNNPSPDSARRQLFWARFCLLLVQWAKLRLKWRKTLHLKACFLFLSEHEANNIIGCL